MKEGELSQKIADMCVDCAYLDVTNGKCKLVPPFLSKVAQEEKANENFCLDAGVFDANGNIIKALNYYDKNVWVLTAQN